MKRKEFKKTEFQPQKLLGHWTKHGIRGAGIMVLFFLFALTLLRPKLATANPPSQENPTPTREGFSVVPPDDEQAEEGEPLEESTEEPTEEPTPTEEPVPDTVEQITATPDADLGEELPEEWGLPINLSQSGATTSPQMVQDNSGNYHVLWQDALDGFVYTTGREDSWSPPIAPELPFTTRRYFPELEEREPTPIFNPTLAADNFGNIHAFWIDDSGDDAILYHSSVPVGAFSDLDSWTERQSLDDAARKIAWTADEAGALHLAYIRPAESARRPSGIYYRRLDPGGNWSNPVLLYASRYLRGVEEDQANIQILSDGSDLFIVWDDTLRQQIYFAHSPDGGEVWQTPQEIDPRSREDVETATGLSNISIGSDGDTLLLTWRGIHERIQQCSQYVSTSTDKGDTWTMRQTLDELPDCLESGQFITNDQGLFLLGTTTLEEPNRQEVVRNTYLLAWDGSRWSDPQLQNPLSRFLNPDTFQPVQLACLTGMSENDKVQFLGCDEGNGQDIWLLSREMDSINDWFPPPSIWIGPEKVASALIDSEDLQLVVDDQGGVHAFWFDDQDSEIYHTSWNGQSWNTPRPIINTPDGNVAKLSASAANGRLYLAWQDSKSGLHFSEADAGRGSEWSTPQLLVEGEAAASSPSMHVGTDGHIVISYAVPLNEQRGIYLLQSADAGETWSDPLLVFDGTGAGWQVVDDPHLAITNNGQYHLVWFHRSLPPDDQTLALAYSRSEDKGLTWSEEEIVTENPAVWSRLLGVDDYIVHLLWAEVNNNRVSIWHDVSMDGGLYWSGATQITGLDGETKPAVAVDAGNRPHLLALENGRLEDFVWSEDRWVTSDDLAVPFAPGGNLSAAGDREIQLLVLYDGKLPVDNEDEEAPGDLYFMWRPFDIPPEQIAPLPTLTPTPQPTSTPTPTATPSPTPTVVFASEQDSGPISQLPTLPLGDDASASLILVAVLPAALIVLLGLLVGLRVVRRR